MESVDVIIPLFPLDYDAATWGNLRERAIWSVYNQTAYTEVTRIMCPTATTLAEARNKGAAGSKADWLIFLDADDELDPHYVEAMLAGSGDMRWPSTIGVYEDGHEDDYPVLLQPKGSLLVHNWMVIGTMIRREQFVRVGGFRDLPILEDWDCFVRLVLAGAKAAPCSNALYRVHVREGSRNQDAPGHGQIYSAIQAEYQRAWASKFPSGDESSMFAM